jgi:aspartyl-tRNA(Asn)/glutamyl-tRNA(Gln) amidotransferase subunit B
MKIGLEVHTQLATNTKLFCGCPNTFVDKPNTLTCDYCIGLPGTKPRLNEKAVEYALKIAAALHCKKPKETFFSRKTYFYPDMGKNYQITQYEVPIALDGFLKVMNKKIRIERINLEEDPARIVHVGTITDSEYLLLDYNRSGVPLCEIVTAPDFTSSREARLFLQELSSVLQYLCVYNPDIEGSMRVDANISISENRVEVKNISGFKDVERALNYELIRQKNLVAQKKKVVRETRGWDADAGVTRSLREKETEEDYGYIFEADLPRITLSEKKLHDIEESIPELADEKLERYVKKLGVGIDLAMSITSEPDLAEMFEIVARETEPKMAAKWFAGDIKKTLNYRNQRIRDTKLKPEHIVKLLKLVERKEVTESAAELILREMLVRPDDPELFLHKENLGRIYDEAVLEPIAQSTLNENPSAILDYKSGKAESINFLVGAVMKKTRGRADPETTRRILERKLK